MLTYRQEERLHQQQNILQNACLKFFLFSCDICWVPQELKLKKKFHHFLHLVTLLKQGRLRIKCPSRAKGHLLLEFPTPWALPYTYVKM